MIRRLLPHPALSVLVGLVWMLLANEFSMGALVLAAATLRRRTP